MSPSVRKSEPVLVRPLRPVSMSSDIKLSPFDRGLAKMSVPALLMFEHPIQDVANTIKRALSQALVDYYPIAGRMVAGTDDGELYIRCSGDGVTFVSASANRALKDFISLDLSRAGRALLDELVICQDGGFGPTDPLLLVQVTEFSCNGFTLGVTWNHALADGAGMAQFLQAVGELACGFSAPSIVPVRCDDSLLQNFPISSAPLQITIPSSLINRIKVEFSKRFTGEPCTKFEVASAVLWQCRTRAIICNPEMPALFSYAVNIRKHAGAKQGYYGNCLTGQLVMATSGIVAGADIVDLVKMIKQSKEKIADQFKKIEDSNQQAVGPQMEQLAQLQYSILIVSSWGNLGFDEVDFGSGGPGRVTPYGEYRPPFPLCAMCLPLKAKDGVNMLGAVVKEEHAGAFLGEIERFTK
ncbi:hypothetical protein HU200_036336 [Digitaria exilis]|uniref:Uncharacterized protein n=1 Tax=Digitaria exilis TaxID=1010633 RepID=A0A835BGL7_9POAL|nr:hypothetical protein HU200_036336 [Digitaria exilis]